MISKTAGLGSLYEIEKVVVLFLHEISLTAGLVRLRDLTGGLRSVAVGSVLSCDFKDGHGSQRWFSLRDCKGSQFSYFTRFH